MKTLVSVLLGLCVASIALAQPTTEVGTPKRTPEDLRKLLAPIALYPDALVALILPATTNSSDLVLAARYLAAQGDPKEIENQPWDESVKSLARYPEVVKWMDENLAWTQEVGEAFAVQPADLMNTVQMLRKEAQASGLLADTPQQKVVVREQEVYIEPAQEDIVYVPYYDPEILVERRPASASWISFGAGFAVGSWLNYDCDWRSRRVLIYGRQPGWRYHPDGRWHTRDPLVPVVYQPWRPGPRYWQHVHDQPRRDYRPVTVVHPSHFVGTPSDRRNDEHNRWDGRRDDSRSDQRHWTQPAANGAPNGQSNRGDGRPNAAPAVTHSTVLPPADANHDSRPNGDRRGGFVRTGNPGAPVTRIDNRITTPPAAAPSAPSAPAAPAPTVSAPAPSSTQNWHQIQEHRLSRPVDAGGQRTFPHQINTPPQHIDPPAETRMAPQSPPSQPRVGGYTRREAPSAPASNPSPEREVRQFSRQPAPAPAPAAATPAAASATPAATPAPADRNTDAGNNSAAPATGRNAGREMHRVLR